MRVPRKHDLRMKTNRQSLAQWSQIEWLVAGEGEITIGRVGRIPCAAVASDGHNALAMLVRRRGESLQDLLTRLDEAVRLAVEKDEYTDEING